MGAGACGRLRHRRGGANARGERALCSRVMWRLCSLRCAPLCTFVPLTARPDEQCCRRRALRCRGARSRAHILSRVLPLPFVLTPLFSSVLCHSALGARLPTPRLPSPPNSALARARLRGACAQAEHTAIREQLDAALSARPLAPILPAPAAAGRGSECAGDDDEEEERVRPPASADSAAEAAAAEQRVSELLARAQRARREAALFRLALAPASVARTSTPPPAPPPRAAPPSAAPLLPAASTAAVERVTACATSRLRAVVSDLRSREDSLHLCTLEPELQALALFRQAAPSNGAIDANSDYHDCEDDDDDSDNLLRV